MAKTTKKQFELFKSECLYWAKKFELSQWRFDILLSPLDDNIQADCYRNYMGRVIRIRFNTTIHKLDGYTWDFIIKSTAKHEMIHALLGELYVLANSRFIHEDEVRSTEEGLVRKLETLIG